MRKTVLMKYDICILERGGPSYPFQIVIPHCGPTGRTLVWVIFRSGVTSLNRLSLHLATAYIAVCLQYPTLINHRKPKFHGSSFIIIIIYFVQ